MSNLRSKGNARWKLVSGGELRLVVSRRGIACTRCGGLACHCGSQSRDVYAQGLLCLCSARPCDNGSKRERRRRLVLHMFRAAGNFSQRKISYVQKLLILGHIKSRAWAQACYLKE